MYCVIIEWGDGTVVANGPYDDVEPARQAAFFLATSEAEEQEMSIRQASDDCWIVGDDGQDQIDVYAVQMGEPVKIAADSRG